MRNTLIALVVTAAVLPGAGALAATRVAVAPFEGDRSGDVRDTVVELLENDYRVMPVHDVELGMRRLDMDAGIERKKSMAKLAAELDADAVVVGSVEPDGNKTSLRMRLYVKKSKRAFQFSTRFQKASQVRESTLQSDIRAKLGPGLRGTEISRRRSLTGDDDERPREDDRGREDTRRRDDGGGDGGDTREGEGDDDRDRKRTALSDDDAEGEVRAGDDDGEREDEGKVRARTSLRRSARNAAIRFEAGASGTGRQLTFVSNLPSDTAPTDYKSSLVPGARLHGELYPLAFVMPTNLAAGLGVSADYEQALGLKTTVTRGGESTQLTTTSRYWEVAGRWRIAWGNRAMNPSFTIGAGYGHREFTFDRGPLMGVPLDVPNVGYRFVSPQLWARFPLHPTFAISGGGRFLWVRQTGGIGRATEYGQAKVYGVDAELGFEFVIGRYVLLHVAGLYTQYGYTYSEATAGEKATNRDGDPDDLDVGGARDRYFGGMGTVGVVF